MAEPTPPSAQNTVDALGGPGGAVWLHRIPCWPGLENDSLATCGTRSPAWIVASGNTITSRRVLRVEMASSNHERWRAQLAVAQRSSAVRASSDLARALQRTPLSDSLARAGLDAFLANQPDQALRWYTLAALAGSPVSSANVAWLQLKTRCVGWWAPCRSAEERVCSALRWSWRAAVTDDRSANQAAELLERGMCPSIRSSIEAAARLRWAAASRSSDPEALFGLGRLALEGQLKIVGPQLAPKDVQSRLQRTSKPMTGPPCLLATALWREALLFVESRGSHEFLGLSVPGLVAAGPLGWMGGRRGLASRVMTGTLEAPPPWLPWELDDVREDLEYERIASAPRSWGGESTSNHSISAHKSQESVQRAEQSQPFATVLRLAIAACSLESQDTDLMTAWTDILHRVEALRVPKSDQVGHLLERSRRNRSPKPAPWLQALQEAPAVAIRNDSSQSAVVLALLRAVLRV